MTLGALDVLESLNDPETGDMILITVDGEKEAVDALKAGRLNCVVQCTPDLGADVMKLVSDLKAGKELQKVPSHKIISLGLAHVPEGRHVFARMTVEENLRMGAYIQRDQKSIQKNLDKVYEYFPRLKERWKQLAGTLSGGEQQMLATGRALMTDPTIVLMDEPSMGLSPLLVKEIFSIIETLHRNGITILLVEQNAKMALAVSDRAYVLETGTISMSGKAEELANDDRVRKAYLGA
jgi:branched-chain amino acid transport system ATP-binding protein